MDNNKKFEQQTITSKSLTKRTGRYDIPLQTKLALLNYDTSGESVLTLCRKMGVSRDSYYRFLKEYKKGGIEGLKKVNRRKPLIKNRVKSHIETAVCNFALAHPQYGQQAASNFLAKSNIIISPSGVRSVWQRHDLETCEKRFQAIRAQLFHGDEKSRQMAIKVLQAKNNVPPPTDVECHGPGFLCYHGLRPLTWLEGIGQVYQQIFVEYYSRHAFVQVCTDKSDETVVSFLTGCVIPWFQAEQVPVIKILTDRGQSFCGRGQHNNYQAYLKAQGIRQKFRTSQASRQQPLPWDDLHKTMEHEFYRFALRKRPVWTLDELQVEVDRWVSFYNRERVNSHQFCYGKTPYQTFVDAAKAAPQAYTLYALAQS